MRDRPVAPATRRAASIRYQPGVAPVAPAGRREDARRRTDSDWRPEFAGSRLGGGSTPGVVIGDGALEVSRKGHGCARRARMSRQDCGSLAQAWCRPRFCLRTGSVPGLANGSQTAGLEAWRKSLYPRALVPSSASRRGPGLARTRWALYSCAAGGPGLSPKRLNHRSFSAKMFVFLTACRRALARPGKRPTIGASDGSSLRRNR
jgi:hypothetical protein